MHLTMHVLDASGHHLRILKYEVITEPLITAASAESQILGGHRSTLKL